MTTNPAVTTLKLTHVYLPDGSLMHVVGNRSTVKELFMGKALSWVDLQVATIDTHARITAQGEVTLCVPLGIMIGADHDATLVEQGADAAVATPLEQPDTDEVVLS